MFAAEKVSDFYMVTTDQLLSGQIVSRWSPRDAKKQKRSLWSSQEMLFKLWRQ